MRLNGLWIGVAALGLALSAMPGWAKSESARVAKRAAAAKPATVRAARPASMTMTFSDPALPAIRAGAAELRGDYGVSGRPDARREVPAEKSRPARPAAVRRSAAATTRADAAPPLRAFEKRLPLQTQVPAPVQEGGRWDARLNRWSPGAVDRNVAPWLRWEDGRYAGWRHFGHENYYGDLDSALERRSRARAAAQRDAFAAGSDASRYNVTEYLAERARWQRERAQAEHRVAPATKAAAKPSPKRTAKSGAVTPGRTRQATR